MTFITTLKPLTGVLTVVETALKKETRLLCMLRVNESATFSGSMA